MINSVPIVGLGNKATKAKDSGFFLVAAQGEVSVKHGSHLMIEIILQSKWADLQDISTQLSYILGFNNLSTITPNMKRVDVFAQKEKVTAIDSARNSSLMRMTCDE